MCLFFIFLVDGTPLKTDSTGRYVNLQGEQLATDDFGRPLDPLTEIVLPRNNYGQYVYVAPVTEPTEKFSSKPLNKSFVIIDGNGVEILPSLDGKIRDRNGNLITTNSEGLLTNLDGKLLATDFSGRFLLDKDSNLIAPKLGIKTLPTDSGGQFVFPIVDSDGYLLNKDSNGNFVDENEEPIPRDEFGRHLDKFGKILDVDEDGNYILKVSKLKPTIGKVPISAINAENGRLLPTDLSGNIVSVL